MSKGLKKNERASDLYKIIQQGINIYKYTIQPLFRKTNTVNSAFNVYRYLHNFRVCDETRGIVRHITSLACTVVLAVSCASTKLISVPMVRSELAAIRDGIDRDPSSITRLAVRRVGATGFYYVLDGNGTVVSHPQSALVGTNFRQHWLFALLEREKNGCVTYQLGRRIHAVFFERLEDGGAVCLSILVNELSPPPADCIQPE